MDPKGQEDHLVETKEINCRKLLLDFYSSQINTHARLLIGFTVVLFTLTDITLKLSGVGTSNHHPLSQMQSDILVPSVFLASLAFWYLLFRDLAYGVLSNSVLHAPIMQATAHTDTVPQAPAEKPMETPTEESRFLNTVRSSITDYAFEQRILARIPCFWFISTGRSGNIRQRVFGLMVCAGLAALTTFLLFALIFLETK